MKIYNKLAYIIITLVVFALGFSIYKVYGKNSAEENIKDKSLSEIKYLENKFLNLFNQLNNISFENYTISSSEIKQHESQKESSNSSEESSSSGGAQEKEKAGGSESSSSSQSSGNNSSSSQDNKQYKLEEKGILTKDSDINWNQIKNDVENIYTSLYSTTLDLYQISINQQDIINFNKEYDNLTKAVKDENKEDTLMELSLLYDYLPRLMENCTNEEKDKTIIKTKNYIFKAYSVLDKEEWTTISENVNSATQEFTKIVTDISNKEKGNQYTINKVYVMINELQNAVLLKDKDVFLIKYKNLLEELQNI